MDVTYGPDSSDYVFEKAGEEYQIPPLGKQVFALQFRASSSQSLNAFDIRKMMFWGDIEVFFLDDFLGENEIRWQTFRFHELVEPFNPPRGPSLVHDYLDTTGGVGMGLNTKALPRPFSKIAENKKKIRRIKALI